MRVLAAGIDSVYLSAKGELRDGLLNALQAAREQDQGEAAVFDFDPEEGSYLLRPHGWRGYPYWLSSPRFELMIGAAPPFPPVYLMLHSPYLHTVGIEAALAEAEAMLSRHVFAGACVVNVSRADLYADIQGWTPRLRDLDRFVCRAVRRRMFFAKEAYTANRRLSGFTFGKGDLLARIYDKTAEIRSTGDDWPELLWQGANRERPVWRVEFQFRSKALRNFGITTPYGLLVAQQDLWEYGTRWLTLRRPTKHAEPYRWPEAPTWSVIRSVQMGSPACGLVRERIRETDTRRLVRGFLGYAAALAALTDADDLDVAITRSLPIVRRYLADRGTGFPELVQRKRRTRSRP